MTKRGFTLIETLVYLALFALIIGGLVAASYLLFETSERNQTKAMLQEEQNFLLGKINWALSGATTTTVTAPNALTVLRNDGTTVTIGTSTTFMTINGSTVNNSDITLTRLLFIYTYAGGANPESIEAGVTVSTKTPTGSTISDAASTTRYIRR
jgi:Tfp pilus assembly protein PilE